ncbi:MAG: class I SAM-dependent methyltransferase [Parvularculaceae bacterium]
MAGMRDSARRIVSTLGLAPLWLRYRDWRRAQDAETVPSQDEEGIPLPPARLMSRVIANADWRYFLDSGRQSLEVFKGAADRNGVDFSTARRVLDLGCGCGRLARHLPKFTKAEIFGVDYDRELANWCARHLRGDFRRNALNPPLEFPNAFFDVVYLYSVFTHQRLATQNAWLAELDRVIAPGGIALVTIHDEDHPALAGAGLTREEVLRRGFVVHNDAAEGSNFMATFQSREVFRTQAAPFFEVAELVPGDKSGVEQTLAVLRKRQESPTGNRQPATG